MPVMAPISHFSLPRRAIAWLTVMGLLSNFLLPGALSMAAGAGGFSICSAASAGGPSGKAKPGILAHHCALCAEPTALPFGHGPGILPSTVSVERPHLRLRGILLAAADRHGRVQARAPPFHGLSHLRS